MLCLYLDKQTRGGGGGTRGNDVIRVCAVKSGGGGRMNRVF